MVVEQNLSDIIYTLPQELVGKISFLVTVLQALGIFLILYVVFNIISLISSKKKRDEMVKINKNLEEIKNLLKK